MIGLTDEGMKRAYPSERQHVPRWLIDELLARLKQQLDPPPARVKTCRGRLFSQIDYEAAVKDIGPCLGLTARLRRRCFAPAPPFATVDKNRNESGKQKY
jgi:hypothetical protein